MSIFYDFRKACFGVTQARDHIDQLEQAIRARDEALLKAEQARWDADSNDLNVAHQQKKIERLLEAISTAAKAGQLKKAELRSVKPHLPDSALASLG